MRQRIMPKYGFVNYRSVLGYIDYIGNRGVNMSRAEDCTYYNTELVNTPIDFSDAEPVLMDKLPPEYKQALREHAQPIDSPDYKSEWDTKLVPVVWEWIQERAPDDWIRSLKRRVPWF